MARIIVASDWAPIRAFEPIVAADPEAVYGDMLPVLRRADLRIVNCECALTAARKPVWKSGAVFKGLPAHAAGLAAVPFEAATLANNHVFDYGLAGFKETLRVLRRSGIRTVGAGLSHAEAAAPLRLKAGGERVTVVNFGEGEDLTASTGGPGTCGWEIERLASEVRRARKRGDFVLAIGHAGLEYIPFPPPYVAAAFRALADAGADCVIGHHPHVPQGLEMRRGRLIAYSLGNFAFFQPAELHYRRTGFCLALEVRAGRLASFEIHPYRVTGRGLRALDGGEEREFRRDLRRVSSPLAAARGVAEAWQTYLAYYGARGFREEVLGILGKMESDPRKGAAMFRNRLTTLQHAELWRDALTRLISEKPVPARPAWTRLIDEWLTRPLAQGSR
ncbi:MAG TPA: CapA family protein [Candidatus Aminicenantes bacterium]|nr:CapA family protein [Candidatus Aminicenantes bacterium]HRY65440.1 CapA family protein [Candidatus Aminicenantes bacterium]HRZ72092.1 CapA family protein [Candidatus Aminicenantes bacterium]